MPYDRVLLALQLAAELDESDPKGVNLAKWLKDAEQCLHLDHCLICSAAQTPLIDCSLEEHHVAGRARGKPYLPDTVTICQPCHVNLTDYQKRWLVQTRDADHQLSGYLFGWADIFDLLYEKTGVSCFLRLGRKFRAKAWHLRNASKRSEYRS